MASLETVLLSSILVGIVGDAKQYAAHTRHRCIPELSVAWSHELSSGPFASTPLISDIDVDGELDVAVTAFSGEIDVVRAKDGQRQAGFLWPFRLLQGSFYASPLQYDINRDGILDIVACSSLGQLLFLNHNGQLIRHFQLPHASVHREWFKFHPTIDIRLIRDFVADGEKSDSYVSLDPHILATPVIDDVNGDGIAEELILPVSYYMDADDYIEVDVKFPVSENVNVTDYVVSSLVYFNLTSFSTYQTVFLDLTKMSSNYRAYVLSSPTVADVDLERRGLETLIGTAAGFLHMIDANGNSIEPFPLRTGVMQTQVVTEDMDANGDLEAIIQEVGGRVICYNLPNGRLLWQKQLTGEVPLSMRVIDLENDLHPELLVTTDDGQMWVLDGATGEIGFGWPVRVDNQISGATLVTQLYGLDKMLFINLDRSGELHALTADRECQYRMALHESSLVGLVSHDLLPNVPGLELLVASTDGALLCLTADTPADESGNVERSELKAFSWPAEHRSHNDFMFNSFLMLTIDDIPLPEVTSYSFSLRFTIIDVWTTPASPYLCQVSAGGIMLHSAVITVAGQQSFVIASPRQPLLGHLVVECRTRHGKVLRDIAVARFNKTFLSDLQWMLIGPTLATLLFLLFFYGFPASDLLPVTMPAKGR